MREGRKNRSICAAGGGSIVHQGQGRTEQGHGQSLQIKLGIGRSWAATYKTLSKNNFHGNERKKGEQTWCGSRSEKGTLR